MSIEENSTERGVRVGVRLESVITSINYFLRTGEEQVEGMLSVISCQ